MSDTPHLTAAPTDTCGSPTCNRPLGSMLCDRCWSNLTFLAKALDAEGVELKPTTRQPE